MKQKVKLANDAYDKRMREMAMDLEEFNTLVSVLEIVGYIGARACMMRQQGLSIRQIANKLSKPKTTVGVWCKTCDDLQKVA